MLQFPFALILPQFIVSSATTGHVLPNDRASSASLSCCSLEKVKGAPERALMARRFRKEFVKLFIKTHISNAELRVEKVTNPRCKNIFIFIFPDRTSTPTYTALRSDAIAKILPLGNYRTCTAKLSPILLERVSFLQLLCFFFLFGRGVSQNGRIGLVGANTHNTNVSHTGQMICMICMIDSHYSS